MNDISIKQNEPENLKIQCYAKYLYEYANIVNYCVWAGTAISIVLNIFKDVIGSELSGVIGLSITIFTIFANKYLSSIVNKAAATKKMFDYSVFSYFSEPNDYNGISRDELILDATKSMNRHIKYYNEKMNSTGLSEKKGVKDWYENIDENIDIEKAIKECQRQNSGFDRELSKTVIIMLSVLLIIIIIFFIIFVQIYSSGIISIVLLFSPFITKSIYTIMKIVKYCIFEHNQRLLQKEGVFDDVEKKQKYIDERRKMEFFIPNFIYNKKSKAIRKDIINSQRTNK